MPSLPRTCGGRREKGHASSYESLHVRCYCDRCSGGGFFTHSRTRVSTVGGPSKPTISSQQAPPGGHQELPEKSEQTIVSHSPSQPCPNVITAGTMASAREKHF